jgi:hypothetical protein
LTLARKDNVTSIESLDELARQNAFASRRYREDSRGTLQLESFAGRDLNTLSYTQRIELQPNSYSLVSDDISRLKQGPTPYRHLRRMRARTRDLDDRGQALDIDRSHCKRGQRRR